VRTGWFAIVKTSRLSGTQHREVFVFLTITPVAQPNQKSLPASHKRNPVTSSITATALSGGVPAWIQ
ncbi:MAG: hypothetical protein RMM51_11235, partial [Verrucomicrobiae bacterium]|nr:hypothetical protein [Verrucomicrobiae bacterium]